MISKSIRSLPLLAVLLTSQFSSMAFEINDLHTETETRAKAIYNILQFVEFPEGSFADSSEPINICIVGKDSFGKHLDYVFAGRRINGRTVNLSRVKDVRQLKKAEDRIHVVYASRSLKGHTAGLINGITGRGCLIIGEIPGFCQLGGMIQIKVLSSKARFNVNTTAVWQEDIKISSQLLKLATIVKTEALAK